MWVGWQGLWVNLRGRQSGRWAEGSGGKSGLPSSSVPPAPKGVLLHCKCLHGPLHPSELPNHTITFLPACKPRLSLLGMF